MLVYCLSPRKCGTLCKLGFSLPVDSDVICCCTVDLLEAGSVCAALTRYLIFLQLLPLVMMHTFGLSCTISHFSLRCRQWLRHVVYICLIHPARRCSKWEGSIFVLITREHLVFHSAHFILQELSSSQAWLQYADVMRCLYCRVGGAGYLEIMNPCG